MIIKNASACGEYVLLKAVKSAIIKNETEGGIVLADTQESGTGINKPTHDGKETVRIFIDSIGNLVPENCGFKIGQEVIVNDYDLQSFGDDEGKIFGIVHFKNVKAVLETE